MKDIQGKYITINCWNEWYEYTTRMIMEHYDNEEYNNTVFVLGSYCFHAYSYFKELYEGKKIIIYQMEQLFNGPDEHWVNVEAILGNLEKVDKTSGDEIWDMCLINKAFMEEYGIEVDKVVPFKFSKSLEEFDQSVKPEIDILFYGNLNKRRAKVLADLSYYFYFQNVSISWIAGLSLNNQRKYMEKSKIILNLHHTETFNRQEQPRIFYALINKKCVVSEFSTKNYFGEAVVETSSLTSAIENLLELDRYKEQAEKGYNLFKKDSKYATELV